MPVNTIWVFAEAFEGAPVASTLELLTKAREVGGTVEAWYGAGDTESVAPAPPICFGTAPKGKCFCRNCCRRNSCRGSTASLASFKLLPVTAR